jgi:hypothetical protein
MRRKLVHGTNAMICAKSVLPTQMRASGLVIPGTIAETGHPILVGAKQMQR